MNTEFDSQLMKIREARAQLLKPQLKAAVLVFIDVSLIFILGTEFFLESLPRSLIVLILMLAPFAFISFPQLDYRQVSSMPCPRCNEPFGMSRTMPACQNCGLNLITGRDI